MRLNGPCGVYLNALRDVGSVKYSTSNPYKKRKAVEIQQPCSLEVKVNVNQNPTVLQ